MSHTQEKLAITPKVESPFLVFGLSGRLGSGCTFVGDKLNQCLTMFDYEVELVDVADVFLKEHDRYLSKAGRTSGDSVDPKASNVVPNHSVRETPHEEPIKPVDRVREYQKRGNLLRQAYGNDVMAALCVSEVLFPHIQKTNSGLSKRQALIIDSLKHPAEVDLLRSIFGSSFYMVGVVANDRKRMDRLRERKGFDERTFQELSDIDANESGQEHGQQTIKTVTKADYFFANDYATKDEIFIEAERLMKLIFGIGIQSPRRDEIGMQLAYKAAARSACLSRQVGAAILDGAGNLLSTGHNDVPKFRGGLYGPDPGSGDKRCWASGGKCYNDEEKQLITEDLMASIDKVVDESFDELFEALNAQGILREPIDDSKKSYDSHKAIMKSRISQSVQNTRIRNLIEFTRAVHAETDAIITVARTATPGIVGSTLYCTTYPCHSCAKHIVDAGIVEVIYLEPYEKSLARKLHSDTINDPLQEKQEKKVQFNLYGGVGPSRYDLFFYSKPDERKQNGKYYDKDRQRTRLMPIGAEESSVLLARIRRVADEMEAKIERFDVDAIVD